MYRSAVFALGALFVFAMNAKADVFYWKAVDTFFAKPSNWDVGGDGAGNNGNLVPGENDEIYGAREATWDFGGGTHTVGKWDSINDYKRYYIYIQNGVLNVKQRISHNDTIVLNSGAALHFPEGSFYAPSRGCSGSENVTVKGNAKFVVKGTFTPYRIWLTTERYGESIIDPSAFAIDSNSAQTNWFDIAGTNIFPRGLVWTGGGNAACSLAMNISYSGWLLAAGRFDRNGQPGTFNLDLNGGRIEALGDLSFVGMDNCYVSAGSTFIANDGDSIDASNFKYYKHTHDDNGNEIFCYKLGNGTLMIGSDLPPRFQVNSGTIAVRGERSDLDGMVFAGSSVTVRWDVAGCRLDNIMNENEFSRITFKSGIDLSALSSGAVLFSSADGRIRGAMKNELVPPEGFSIVENGDSLILMKASDVVFDSSKSGDLSVESAWSTGAVPVGGVVVLDGGGTVTLNNSSPEFSRIIVQGGTVLSIEGGSAGNPFVPPKLAMRYAGKILCADGSHVRLENEIESLPLPTSLPVFEIATNAVVYPAVPDQYTKGISFKNLHFNYFGTMIFPDATRLQTPCVTFGTADAETAYFGMNVDGGRLIVTNKVSGWQGNASLLRIMCPENGGVVHPVGEFVWRNFRKGPNSYGAGNSTTLSNSGYHIGVGNPIDVVFTVNVSGTPIALNGTSIISGGANIVCSGVGSGLEKENEFISYTLTQYVEINGAACITLKDGARFSNSFCVGSEGRVVFNPEALGHCMLVNDGGITELYRVGGNNRASARLKNCCWDVGRLIPECLDANKPTTGWVGAPYSDVFYAFRAINLTGLVQIRGTDGFPRPDWWNFDGYWDHVVKFNDMPVSGTGSLLVTNTTENNSMTLIMVHKDNTATGEISAAPGTRSRLLFRNNANWNGTVVANGCAGLVNTDENTGIEKPASVKFKDMRMDGEFPIRIWNSGTEKSNDFIEISGSVSGSDGGFLGVPMDGHKPNPGDSYRFATYPATAELPVNAVPRWRVSSVPHDDNPSIVVLVLTYQPPGTTIVLR